jgi:hypothetical protein
MVGGSSVFGGRSGIRGLCGIGREGGCGERGVGEGRAERGRWGEGGGGEEVEEGDNALVG